MRGSLCKGTRDSSRARFQQTQPYAKLTHPSKPPLEKQTTPQPPAQNARPLETDAA